jgi:hypothetical protein
MNKNISTTGDTTPIPPISIEELNQSLDSLDKKINQKIFNESTTNMKSFILKISYELGYYYYMMNDFAKMKFYFDFCIYNLKAIIEGGVNLSSFKTIYFDHKSLATLLKFVEQNDNLFIEEETNNDTIIVNKNSTLIGVDTVMTDVMYDENNNKQISSQNFFNFNDNQGNIVEDDFSNFFKKLSIDPSEKTIIEKFTVDDNKLLGLLNIEELLSYSENLIFLAFKNCNLFIK